MWSGTKMSSTTMSLLPVAARPAGYQVSSTLACDSGWATHKVFGGPCSPLWSMHMPMFQSECMTPEPHFQWAVTR